MTTTNQRPQGPTDRLEIQRVTVPRSFEEKAADAATTAKEQLTTGLTGKLVNPEPPSRTR